MKIKNLLGILFVALIALTASTTTFAQDGPPPDGPPNGRRMGPPPDGPPDDRRPNDRGAMLRDLGLSKDQLQQLRRINQGRKPVMDAAHHRMNEANRLLDEAIYSDTLNEQEVQNRMKEVQAAQADLVRLRFTNELEVRKVLTPEQLVKFRDLRDRFERAREDKKDRIDNRRPNRPQNGQPLRQVNNPPGRRPGN